MNRNSIPSSALTALEWDCARFEPYYNSLAQAELTSETLERWMADWSHLTKLVKEVFNRLNVATTVDTTDEAAYHRFSAFLEDVYPQDKARQQTLKEKLLDSGLHPENFAVQLRNMRAEADLYAESNLPLLSQEKLLSAEYDKITGAQTVPWEGEEVTLQRLSLALQDENRDRRQRAWHAWMARWSQDREPLNQLWRRLMDLRGQIA